MEQRFKKEGVVDPYFLHFVFVTAFEEFARIRHILAYVTYTYDQF